MESKTTAKPKAKATTKTVVNTTPPWEEEQPVQQEVKVNTQFTAERKQKCIEYYRSLTEEQCFQVYKDYRTGNKQLDNQKLECLIQQLTYWLRKVNKLNFKLANQLYLASKI
jgi:hypothetical protein